MITYYSKDAKTASKEYILQLLATTPEAIALDIETPTTTERMPLGISIAFSPDEAIYFQLYPEYPQELDLAKHLLCNPNICKIAHYALFDFAVLPLIPELSGFDRSNIFDTNTAARLIGRVETALEMLAPEVNMEVEGAKTFMARLHIKTMLEAPPAELANKCQKDARAAFALYLRYKPYIDKHYKEYFKVETSVVPILIDMSMRGIAIDQKARAEMTAKIEGEVEFYRKMLLEAGIEKPGSPQQIGYILGKRGSFLPLTKSKRQLSTDEKHLQFLDDPVAEAVLEYRGKSKLLNTYLYPMAGMNRFYTEFYLDTVVGRLNSKNRNIQNIPPDCRHILRPDNGCFTSMDYRMEHLYILAHMSGDRDMLSVLYDPDPQKSDLHQFTADKMHITRHLAKTVNYAMPYGGTASTISDNAKIRDKQFCGRLLDDWFRAYPGAADWIVNAKRQGVKEGWSLPTLFNRRIAIPEEYNKWGALYVEGMERKAVNYPILGCIPASNRILTLRAGYIPISSAMSNEAVWDGSRFVNANVAYSGKKQLVEVTLASGYKFHCSPDHKLLVENSKRSRIWKTPQQIKQQDNLCISEGYTNNSQITIQDEPITTHWKAPNGIGNTKQQTFSSVLGTTDLGFALGRLASDGWYSVEKRTLRWIVADNELAILDKLKNILSVFKYSEREVIRQDRNMTLYYIDIYSVQLAKQAETMGVGKHIPSISWKNSDMLRGYLSGLFDGDGTVADAPILSIGGQQVYSGYPEEVQQALLVLGIRSTVRRYYNIYTNHRLQDIAKVRVRAKDNYLFHDIVGFANPVKRDKLLVTPSVFSPRISRHTERIRSVTFTSEYVDMYDIVNSDSGQFMTEGYITHNSDGEIIKRAFVICCNKGLGPPVMAITAHDSIDFDGDVKIPVEELEQIPGFKIPVETKQTITWE